MGVMTETAGFLEREVMPNFAVRTGVVYRHLTTPKARFNSYPSAERLQRAGQRPGSGAGRPGRLRRRRRLVHGVQPRPGGAGARHPQPDDLAQRHLQQLHDLGGDGHQADVESLVAACDLRPHLGARLGLDRDRRQRQLQPERHHQRRRRRPREVHQLAGEAARHDRTESRHPHLAGAAGRGRCAVGADVRRSR